MDNLVGRNIGRHQIVSVIGQGGMGTVYAACAPNFQRNIAIKVLPTSFSHQPEIGARFEREARTIAALEHPTIIPVYDFGQLMDWIHDYKMKSPPDPPEDRTVVQR